METNTLEKVQNFVTEIKIKNYISDYIFRKGNLLYQNGQVQLLSQSKESYKFSVDDEFNDFKLDISINGHITFNCSCESSEWCHHAIAGFLQLEDDLLSKIDKTAPIGKQYTRQGMILRVLEERQLKAKAAKYRINFNYNVFGEHILYNEKNKRYKITFRDFDNKIGYCSCPDYQTNKLGTCKHLMFAFNHIEKNNTLQKKQFSKKYPFVEIFLNPIDDYKITWFYPETVDYEIKELITRHFGNSNTLSNDKIINFINFIDEANNYKQILIRPEVIELVEKEYNKQSLKEIVERFDFEKGLEGSTVNLNLFQYQIEGIKFASFRESAIIADEMGLGKTIQAIVTAILKKKIFHFNKTLIICPASLKEQWKREIEKFTHEKATVVNGLPEERFKTYKTAEEYFLIINYETVLRDWIEINKNNIDFIILDEAQRIKNYETQTSNAIKSLNKKHALVITGTPIENRLIDLYSIVDFLDKSFLSPLWEFSYQHCFFDEISKNKITGYYNLDQLKKKMNSILIRREKNQVIDQLPNISQIDIPVEMSELQADYHGSFAKGIASILAKKIKTPFDMQRLMLLLSKMRMVCDSTYLIDLETNFSPKLKELEYVLLEKLNIQNNNKKILIFSEWKRMTNIIAQMLKKNNITFVELNGSVPVKNRGKIIKEFEENKDCKIFISTEAGGVGLNLQVADTVINFELPWNPAKKNQRIGRIDRIGQLNKNLTVISFITKNSIEMKIASGLVLKQNLFSSVLSPDNSTSIVDFSSSGKAQFLKELETILYELDYEKAPFTEEEIEIEEYTQQKPEEQTQFEEEIPNVEVAQQIEEDIVPIQEKNEEEQEKDIDTQNQEENKGHKENVEELENVMNQGLAFFSGLFKVSTGKEISMDGKGIEINKETGEVTMKFKLPI